MAIRHPNGDVLGMHRKFAGIWVGTVSMAPGAEIPDVEVMIGVRPIVAR